MSIDYIINKIINLDPEAQIYLQPLAHKALSFNYAGLTFITIYCVFTGTYIQISSTKPDHVDTQITASANKMLVTGDFKVAEAIQELVLKLNIDWEEELSKYTGDIIAHQTVYHFKKLRLYQQQSASSLEEMITEYLQEESGLFPTKYEVEELMHAVDELRLDVDRITARVEAYDNN